MANLEQIVSQKTQSDTQWKLERQAERENASSMQDAGITEITSNPESYALIWICREITLRTALATSRLSCFRTGGHAVGTRDRWKTLGRSVVDTEANKGVIIFARTAFSKGTILTDAMISGRPKDVPSRKTSFKMTRRKWRTL
jgi:hypothetical protein